MKNNEYSQFEIKKNSVLKMFKEVNIDEMILDYLESYGYDIKNKNTAYIVKMIKKVLFNEMMSKAVSFKVALPCGFVSPVSKSRF